MVEGHAGLMEIFPLCLLFFFFLIKRVFSCVYYILASDVKLENFTLRKKI